VAATPIGSTAEMVVLRGDRQHTLHVDVGDRSVREP